MIHMKADDLQPQIVPVADGAESAAGSEAEEPLPVRALAGVDGLPLQALDGVHLSPCYTAHPLEGGQQGQLVGLFQGEQVALKNRVVEVEQQRIIGHGRRPRSRPDCPRMPDWPRPKRWPHPAWPSPPARSASARCQG